MNLDKYNLLYPHILAMKMTVKYMKFSKLTKKAQNCREIELSQKPKVQKGTKLFLHLIKIPKK